MRDDFFRKQRKKGLICVIFVMIILISWSVITNPPQSPVIDNPDEYVPPGSVTFSTFPEAASLSQGIWWIFEVNVTVEEWEVSEIHIEDVFGNESSPIQFNETFSFENTTTFVNLIFRYDFLVVGNHSPVTTVIVLPGLRVYNHTIPIEVR